MVFFLEYNFCPKHGFLKLHSLLFLAFQTSFKALNVGASLKNRGDVLKNGHQLKNDNDQILKSVYPSPIIIISASSLVILNVMASSKEELGSEENGCF